MTILSYKCDWCGLVFGEVGDHRPGVLVRQLGGEGREMTLCDDCRRAVGLVYKRPDPASDIPDDLGQAED